MIAEALSGVNRSQVLKHLNSNAVTHVFALYDLQFDPEHSIVHIVFDNNHINGYVLVYTALDVPSVILECKKNAAEILLSHAPENGFIMHAPPNILPIITRKYRSAQIYLEDWMLVRKGKQRQYNSDNVHRLQPKRDASPLAKLLSTREDRPRTTAKKCAEMISKMPMWGVFVESQLVSYAGSFVQLPEAWMIGGVYTHPKHRDKGYATKATSAVTQEALNNALQAVLFARSDNTPALKAYRKIGYRKIGNKLWVDVGTGMKP